MTSTTNNADLAKEIGKLAADMSFFEQWYLLATIGIGFFALVALVISVITYFSTVKSNKAALLHQVKNSIDDAKTHLANLTLELSTLQSKSKLTADERRQLSIQISVYESALEKLLNAYEDGCQKYISKLILKAEFKKSYYGDIRRYIEEFTEKFTGPVTEYTHMISLYKEWHKVK